MVGNSIDSYIFIDCNGTSLIHICKHLDQPFSTRVPRHPGGCLGKMAKNCPKCIYKPAGGTSLPFSNTKPQVFIVHHYNLLAAGILTTNDIIS
ncbi:unnamed protein product [Staurois parvus]|uniref:Uncharacterized protein n=1 Tax=Staurois parvus TaxID=386267 RepID=A0ABN9GHX6_9NEOB|nr:unnamed protein product [Staurois parvus]